MTVFAVYLTNNLLADMPKIKVKRKKRRCGFLSRQNFASAMPDAINTGLNTIERVDPSLTENAKKRLARLLKRELRK